MVEAKVKARVQSYGKMYLKPQRSFQAQKASVDEEFDAPNDTSYQSLQMRGCNIIKADTLEYISVLPIDMAQVLSVEKDQLDTKNEEISYFELDRSDIVLAFHAGVEVDIVSKIGNFLIVIQVLATGDPN
ncbi:hypothetical protein MMC17_002320 [Xylographa soralifera]|nr:hypothetical protein [Xylographa soralifera]